MNENKIIIIEVIVAVFLVVFALVWYGINDNNNFSEKEICELDWKIGICKGLQYVSNNYGIDCMEKYNYPYKIGITYKSETKIMCSHNAYGEGFREVCSMFNLNC